MIWASTPRELFDEFTAAAERRREAIDDQVRTAWFTVAIGLKARADRRLPTLESLLSRDDTPRPVQSAASMRAAMLAFAAAHNAALKGSRRA